MKLQQRKSGCGKQNYVELGVFLFTPGNILFRTLRSIGNSEKKHNWEEFFIFCFSKPEEPHRDLVLEFRNPESLQLYILDQRRPKLFFFFPSKYRREKNIFCTRRTHKGISENQAFSEILIFWNTKCTGNLFSEISQFPREGCGDFQKKSCLRVVSKLLFVHFIKINQKLGF